MTPRRPVTNPTDTEKQIWARFRPTRTRGLIRNKAFLFKDVVNWVDWYRDPDPLESDDYETKIILLATNIYWLVQTYYRVRCIQYPGEKDALEHLQSEEPDLYADIQRFYASQDLQEMLKISERLTDVVLSPIGGQWREGELLAFGTTDSAAALQSKGYEMFQNLLDEEESNLKFR